ncbi:MAG TPA: hypothetical protein VEB19_14730 [Gemmatimonadaceae bacterium]|nr:hypothetical protein [Gemmatimonadaceae bacterium]
MAQRLELKEQMSTLNALRANLRGQIANTESGQGRAQLQARLQEIDARMGRLESQLLSADDAIASALAQGVGVISQEQQSLLQAPPSPAIAPPGPVPGASVEVPDHMFHEVVNNMEESFAAGLFASALGFLVIGTIFYRMARRRTRQLFENLAADQARRFEQLQNAIDVIAVETERISEAQRFVSKRVNELGAGEAQPIGAQRPIAETVRRDPR